MKTLLILRHAKSSRKDKSLPDHDRPLKKRGRNDAPRMGRLIAEEHLQPDRLVSSTALRAQTTAELVAEALEFSEEIELKPELYHAEPEDYLSVLQELEDTADSVLLVGHNPGMEELLEELTGEAEHLPTAALAQVELTVTSWQEVDEKTKGRLVQIWRPKELEIRNPKRE